MRSPVLLIVFNRPDATLRTFESIRRAAPPRLYVAGDGARASVTGETDTVRRVREIATAVDWPCKLMTRFPDRNLGCKRAVISALNWFFANEAEGIVVEDDCLPHGDFFAYCDWALATYRNDFRVFHVNGNNFAAPPRIYGDRPIAFTPLAQVWGWASWADRWRQYEGNPFYVDTSRFRDWPLSLRGRWLKCHHAELLRRGLDTWDFQWQIAILNAGGLCVSSSANLIQNFGDGESATRTKRDPRTRLAIQPLRGPLTRSAPEANKAVTRWYERHMGLSSMTRFARVVAGHIKGALCSRVERLAASVFFGRAQPIVIASTGRAGSTLLFQAIAQAVAEQRFGKAWAKRLPRFVSNRARAFVPRLGDLRRMPHRVLKTHDLYDSRYAGRARFVFVYGDPLESALSVARMVDKHGRIWLDEHQFYLSATGDYDDLFRRDVLNFGAQMRAWSSADPDDVLMVSFDELWDALPAISEFLGLDVSLPPRQPRAPKRPVEYDENFFSGLRDDAMACVAGRKRLKASD